MAKVDKAIPEEIPITEAPAAVQEPAEETLEQQRERLAREDYQKRNEAALVERKAVLERNGQKFEDHTQSGGVEIVRRCCGK